MVLCNRKVEQKEGIIHYWMWSGQWFACNPPISLWGDALSTIVYILNKELSYSAIYFYELWTSIKIALAQLGNGSLQVMLIRQNNLMEIRS